RNIDVALLEELVSANENRDSRQLISPSQDRARAEPSSRPTRVVEFFPSVNICHTKHVVARVVHDMSLIRVTSGSPVFLEIGGFPTLAGSLTIAVLPQISSAFGGFQNGRENRTA